MMPSLFKYFAIVGCALLGVLFVLNSVLEPGGPGPTLLRADVPKAVVKHDPRASKVERLRAEEAAAEKAKVAAKDVPAEIPVLVTEPPMPAQAAVAPPAEAAPAHVSAPVSLATAAPAVDEAERTRLAQQKAKADKAAAKARKAARLARERARTRAIEEASAQAQPQYYGYAPRPAYGPFGRDGWGGGGWNRW